MKQSIYINTCKGPHELLVSTIVRIEGSSNYSKIFFADKIYPLLTTKILHWFEENLNSKSFIRVHKHHLVNLQYIQGLSINNSHVQLNNGETVTISRRKFTTVKKILTSNANN